VHDRIDEKIFQRRERSGGRRLWRLMQIDGLRPRDRSLRREPRASPQRGCIL
jgi:hypothetical protein